MDELVRMRPAVNIAACECASASIAVEAAAPAAQQ